MVRGRARPCLAQVMLKLRPLHSMRLRVRLAAGQPIASAVPGRPKRDAHSIASATEASSAFAHKARPTRLLARVPTVRPQRTRAIAKALAAVALRREQALIHPDHSLPPHSWFQRRLCESALRCSKRCNGAVTSCTRAAPGQSRCEWPFPYRQAEWAPLARSARLNVVPPNAA